MAHSTAGVCWAFMNSTLFLNAQHMPAVLSASGSDPLLAKLLLTQLNSSRRCCIAAARSLTHAKHW